MYAEQVQTTDRNGNPMTGYGLHIATCANLKGLVGLMVNGIPAEDTSGQSGLPAYFGAGKDDEPVELSADTGDPQADRDLVHLGKAVLGSGFGFRLFGSTPIPRDRLNQFANAYRALFLKQPQEGPNQADDKILSFVANKEGFSDYVSGEMSEAVLSKWHVVALGEMQQPGGVGATQDQYNPVLDGANPDDPPSGDMSNNSFEQAVGFETWVNTAVAMLNRGESDEAILAELKHAGCENGPEVLARAKEQPIEEAPIDDEIGQDPFEAPEPDDGLGAGQMESVSQQPPVLAAYEVVSTSDDGLTGGPIGTGVTDGVTSDEEYSDLGGPIGDSQVDPDSQDGDLFDEGGPMGGEDFPYPRESRVRIASSSMTGKVIDRWEGQWGEGFVMVALDEGGTLNVSTDAIEIIEPEQEPEHPVSKIQEYIDSLPQVEPTRPQVEARIAAMEAVRRACRANISKVGFHDQVKLSSMDSDAQAEIRQLREFLGAIANESDAAYLSGQQRYRPHGIAQPGVVPVTITNEEFDRRIAETAAIFAAELPAEVAADAEATAYAAATYAASKNGNVAEFVRLAEEHRVVRTEEFAPTETVTTEPEIDADGPAEGLYL